MWTAIQNKLLVKNRCTQICFYRLTVVTESGLVMGGEDRESVKVMQCCQPQCDIPPGHVCTPVVMAHKGRFIQWE